MTLNFRSIALACALVALAGCAANSTAPLALDRVYPAKLDLRRRDQHTATIAHF